MLDDLGKAEGLGEIEAAAVRYDWAGTEVAKSALSHGLYRVGVHPLGRGIAGMSRECVLHTYDDKLDLTLETSLAKDPAIAAIRRRLDIDNEMPYNLIRTVALSRNADRYLFTVVDEAWCIDSEGRLLWSTKLPLEDGWSRVATSSREIHTSVEVSNALDLMGLSLPLDPEDVKGRYRALAREWHPDLNRGSRESHQRMTALNLAAETLTGIELGSFSTYFGPRFNYRRVEETYRETIRIDGYEMQIRGTMETNMPEIAVADWLYASCFAAESNTAYLGSDAGHVVEMTEDGKAKRVYDIGSRPRKIMAAGGLLYLFTDTRLYVLKDDSLMSITDIFEAGDLILLPAGLGLLQKNQFKWLNRHGEYLGSVASKNPIRRVFQSGSAWVIETRQHRAVIEGPPQL